MNVNFASNSHPGALLPQEEPYDDDSQQASTPLFVADTAEDRRVIIIHEGVLSLNPAVYLADRLYQAFLMYNHKLVLCECFSDDELLHHCLRHLIHAWSAAMKVMFVREDEFLNQCQASLVEVAQATVQWLAVFAEKNLSSQRKTTIPSSGLGTKMPSDGLAADSNNNKSMDASMSGSMMVFGNNNNSKRRYSSSKPKAAGDARKRKATASKAKPGSRIKPQSNKTPRKPSAAASKKSKAAATKKSSLNDASIILPIMTTNNDADDDALPSFQSMMMMNDDDDSLLMQGQEDDQLFALNSTVVDGTAAAPITETEDDGTADATTPTTSTESLEPLDKNDFDSQKGGIPSDYLEFLLPEYSASGNGGGDDSNTTILSSFPPPAAAHDNTQEEEEEDATSTTMTDLLPCNYYSESEEGAMTDSFLDRPFFATEEDVDAFMNNQMPPLLMTSEDSSADSADELLNMDY